MSLFRRGAGMCLVVAAAAVLLAGCPKKPEAPPSPPMMPGMAPMPKGAPPPSSPGVGGSRASAPSEAVTRPWRDESGERQSVITKKMELEVEKVEDAHDKAVNIVQKAGGFIKDEDMRLTESGRNAAHIVARVPSDRLEGVMAQLRELGKVVSLVGQSEDVTKEYTSQGADIREQGTGEDELVAKYEKETDRNRKEELYRQIQANRELNKRRKSGLTDLSEKTHFALIDLTLTQKASPGAFFLHSLGGAGTFLQWLGATAVFWLPLLIVGWLIWRWGKRRPQA